MGLRNIMYDYMITWAISQAATGSASLAFTTELSRREVEAIDLNLLLWPSEFLCYFNAATPIHRILNTVWQIIYFASFGPLHFFSPLVFFPIFIKRTHAFLTDMPLQTPNGYATVNRKLIFQEMVSASRCLEQRRCEAWWQQPTGLVRRTRRLVRALGQRGRQNIQLCGSESDERMLHQKGNDESEWNTRSRSLWEDKGTTLFQVCCRSVNIFLLISISHVLGKLHRNLLKLYSRNKLF